jgi:riboflavin kinase / FMN adenylyltransferase
MRVVRFLHQMPHLEKPSAVAIGNFDGMHLGHQRILKNIKDQAAAHGWSSVVILFEPHPKEYFVPNLAPPRLMRLTDKLLFLAEFGIDLVICLKFDEKLADLSATHFVEKILISQLKISYLSVGEDFRFGRGRQGSVGFLKQTGLINKFQVVTQENICIDSSDTRISSTEIRAFINQGKLAESRTLLGHPIALTGRVIPGEKRGRELGFPTANIRLNRQMAYEGVFAAQASFEGKILKGIANIGTRPTFHQTKNRFLEVYLFDFYGDLYGKRLQIELIHKIRDEMRFESLEKLKTQIAEDILAAKKILNFSGCLS